MTSVQSCTLFSETVQSCTEVVESHKEVVKTSYKEKCISLFDFKLSEQNQIYEIKIYDFRNLFK